MSFISLGKVVTNWSTEDDKFFVAGLIDSASGLLKPQILRDKRYVTTFYGDFEFHQQYQEYIDNGIPVVLIPILTEESKYNRPSLRLNREYSIKDGSRNNTIIYCHPKLDKKYISTSLGGVVEISVTEYVGWFEFELNPNIKFFPTIAVIEDDRLITTDIRFKQSTDGIVTAQVLIPDTGYNKSYRIVYELIPDLDQNHIQVIKDISEINLSLDNRFNYIGLPEVTATYLDDEGYYRVAIVNVQQSNKLHINLENDLSPIINRVDIRYVPSQYVDTVTLANLGVTYITHDTPKYRVVSFESNGKKFLADCLYLNDVEFVITIRDNSITEDQLKSGEIKVKYNVTRLTVDQLNSKELNKVLYNITSFNSVLNFSDSYQFITEIFGVENPRTNFILLNTPSGNMLISTIRDRLYIPVSASNYVDSIYLDYSIEDREAGLPIVLSFIKTFCTEYNNRYSESSKILLELMIEFIQKSLGELITVNNSEFDGHDWSLSESQILDWLKTECFVADFWLAYNSEVWNLIRNQLWDILKVEYNLFNRSREVNSSISSNNLSNFQGRLSALNQSQVWELIIKYFSNQDIYFNKVFLTYSKPGVDPHYFEFSGLKISESFGYSNDVLSELSESYKICEFYSKCKGPAATSIQVSINLAEDFDDLYVLQIGNSLVSEQYLTYVGTPNSSYPTNAIHLSEVGLQSKLVDVYVYNYIYQGSLVDPLEFQFPSDHYLRSEEYTPSLGEGSVPNRYLRLPEGSWNLDRVTPELIQPEDLIETLSDFKESNLYPDLILIDRVPELIYKLDSIVEFNEFIDTISELSTTIYSQTLINLHEKDLFLRWIQSPYRSENNRLLYFWGDMMMADIQLSSLYPYVLDIINSTYLSKITSKLLYDPFGLKSGNVILTQDSLPDGSIPNNSSITHSDAVVHRIYDTYGNIIYLGPDYSDGYRLSNVDSYPWILVPEISGEVGTNKCAYSILDYLKENKINYLQYNNLEYFYKTIYEYPGQPTKFVIQFLTSKISREILKNQSKLKGCNELQLNKTLSTILSNFTKFSPLYQDVKYHYKVNVDTLELTVQARIKSIQNTILTLDYVLNIK